MNIEKSFRTSLCIYALIVLMAGVSHGAWYCFLPEYAEMSGLSMQQWNIVFLFNWSISIALVFIALLSFAVSRMKVFALIHLRQFSLLTIALWICRLILEFVFPVGIPYLILKNPSWIVRFSILILIAILAHPEIRLRLMRRESSKNDAERSS